MKPSLQKKIELQRFNFENVHWCVGWVVSYGKVVADKRWSHKEIRLYLRLLYIYIFFLNMFIDNHIQ